MIVSMIMIVLAFAWLMYETDWLTVKLPYGKALPIVEPNPQAIILSPISKPVLMLNIGNPDKYPMTLKTTTNELKAMLDQLAKTDLTLTEEVSGYDYSHQT